jgi:DNA-binding NtrC family response regulator
MHPSNRKGDVTATLRPSESAEIELPIPQLEITIARQSGKPCGRSTVVQGDRIRIGSHPSNDIILTDRLVSRFHCSLTATPSGWTLTDSGSRNGTFLGGARVRDVDLPRPSCELTLGESTLHLQQLGASSLTHIPACSQWGALSGGSLTMRRLYASLMRVANSDATVLVEGESGTGKELVAKEIIHRGPRGTGPLITVDASSISPSLIESELFGHARGAFTNAASERKGAFEAADGGTLFFDEIGEMPLDLQPKLLRAIESREIRRLGETTARRVDVRLVAATNRDLEREVNRGRFRGDLFFRLAVVTVKVPPLRDRLEDLPLLVRAFLESMHALHRAPLFTEQVLQELAAHDWPGNVRELRNFVERTVIMGSPSSVARARAEKASPAHVVSLDAAVASTWDGAELSQPYKVAKERLLTRFEVAYLSRLLETCEGNVSQAARHAQLDRMHLSRLMRSHGLKPKFPHHS